MQFSSLIGLLPFLASAQAYFILSHTVLTTTRMDPIVQPGGVSQHVHSIVGGSNFDKTMSYQSARASTCTTAGVSEDKSNYWTPQLYYYNPKDASFQAIPVAYVNTYYLPRAGKDGKVQAFPDGLRMVSGSPNRRTFNNDADSKAATYVCLDYSGSHQGDPDWAERNSFFTHNCPQGMRAQIFFRSCWDGVNLDSPDHVSHMAWPSGGVDGGECPASHPVRLVSLFYEFIYQVQNFPFNDPQYPTWVFANGDTTGYGMHGDFLNGWPAYNNGTNILQAAIDGCNDDNGVGGELNNCDPFVPYLKSGAGCGPQNLLVDEDVGFDRALSKLPGNNMLWIGNSTTKPVYANYTETATNYTNFHSAIPDGYTETGCIAEATTGRALNAQLWAADNMTRGACVSWCQGQGYPLAGVQYGRECRCDMAMRNGASNTTLLDPTQCSMDCSGNSYETCGGSRVMNLYNNPNMYPAKALPKGWRSAGCYTEGSNGRALASYSFASDSMTQELCMTTCQSKGYKYAGAEWSRECYCSNSFGTGSQKTDDSTCNMMCSGDQLSVCGGSQRLTVFSYDNSTTPSTVVSSAAPTSANATSTASSTSANVTSTTATSANVTSTIATSVNATSTQTVVVATTNSTSTVVSSTASVSNSTSVASSTTSSKPVSVSSSSSVAVSSSISSAAVSSSSVSPSASKSSSSVASSSSTSSAAATTSSAPVSSSSSSSSSTAVSSTSSAAPSPVATAAAIPSGWAANGCMTEATSVRALSGYSISANNMTYNMCLSACAARGYLYGGVEYGRECYCGDGFNTGAVSAPDSQCSKPCAGDSTSICGGSNRLTTFVNTNPPVPATLPQGWTAQGCYNEASSGRALSAYSFTSKQMTPQLCVAGCAKKGYTVAGVEYGAECYCDNSLAKATQSSAAKCGMSCSGDLTARCGGPSLLNIYTINTAPSSSAAPAPASSSTSSAVPTSSSAAPASSSASPAPAASSSISSSAAAAAATKRARRSTRRRAGQRL